MALSECVVLRETPILCVNLCLLVCQTVSYWCVNLWLLVCHIKMSIGLLAYWCIKTLCFNAYWFIKFSIYNAHFWSSDRIGVSTDLFSLIGVLTYVLMMCQLVCQIVSYWCVNLWLFVCHTKMSIDLSSWCIKIYVLMLYQLVTIYVSHQH